MKKILALTLALILCFGLVACGGVGTPDTVSAESLYEDPSNLAKCKMNVGKQVTIFGQISKIDSKYCDVNLSDQRGYQVAVYMSTETLAEFSVDQFIAVTGIIMAVYDEYNSYTILTGKTLRYEIRATKIEDSEKMDSIFGEFVSNKIEDPPLDTVYSLKNHIYTIYDYISTNCTDDNLLRDNTALSQYLCGNWICGHYNYYSPYDTTESDFELVDINFYDTGKLSAVIMNHNGDLTGEEKSWLKSWSVNNGMLDSFIYNSPFVYILTEDLFICQNYIFVRQK